ncbi:hypothetical protein GCM10022247_04820 [Allokutzneria multivorans]|uniref:P-type E1-E2 ATPase n=1 Tax=Allokutzneria multivorans TaxID=1142134 RepID=A0ABP7QXM9_9PSEU
MIRVIDAGLAYASRVFRAPAEAEHGFPLVLVSPDPTTGQGGAVVPIELVSPWPAGFLVLGDALATFNPCTGTACPSPLSAPSALGRVGSDVTLKAADVVVVRDELAAVPAVVALSRRARRVVVQNLVLAGAFIAGLVLWDLFGTLPLPLGVLGHEGSTVVVGLNGLRLLRDTAWSARAHDRRQAGDHVQGVTR